MSIFLNGEPQQVEIVTRTDAKTLILYALGLFGNAYILMLILGTLHSAYPNVPAMSYWMTFLAFLGLNFVGTALNPTNRVWTKSRS